MNWLKKLWEKLFPPKVKVEPLPKVNEKPKPIEEPQPLGDGLQAALPWELPCSDSQVTQGPHPERREWSNKIYQEIDKHYLELMSAKDIDTLIPMREKLSRAQKVTLLSTLMSVVAKYEASWNAACTSKDVNGRSESEYKATGLFQMNSADDQRNYRTSTNYSYKDLLNPLINIEVGVKILVTVVKVRGKITFSKDEKSPVLRYFYATLLTDNKVGPIVLKEAKARINYLVSLWLGDKSEVRTESTNPPWYDEAKKYESKNENDPDFNKLMSSKWSLFGMNLGTIAKSWAAWCGLAGAVVLVSVGLNYPKDGATAKNWDKFDAITINYKVDGAPKGAFARLNHYGDCNREDGNHLTQFNGDCSAEDLKKSGAPFDGYGGNQGNAWKLSTYKVTEICRVLWPKDAKEKPRKITKSINCVSGKSGSESTR